MKRCFALVTALMILLSLPACGKKEYDYPEEKIGGIKTENGNVYPETFLSFNGEAVSFDMFRYYYLNYRDEYLKGDKDYFKKEGTEAALKEEVLNCLLDYYAIRFLAEEYDVELSEEEMDAVRSDIEKTVEFYGNEDAFLEVIHESYMSHGLYYKMMEYSSLYQKLFYALYEDGGEEAWSDEEYEEYYRSHYLAIQHVFLPYAEGESEEKCEATMAEAERILGEAKAGSDFWKLVETYGKDEGMLDHPDGLYLTDGEGEDVLIQAAKELTVGQISDPVKAKGGVHIIKRLEMSDLRIKENRSTALFGYYDTLDQWHPGAYDDAFQTLYREKAKTIKADLGEYWSVISTETVY